MGSCQMLAEPRLPTPKCCYRDLQAELRQYYSSLMLHWWEARPSWPLSFSDSPISPTCLYLHLFPLPLHTVGLLHLYSNRGRGNGLEEQMFTLWSLWLPGYILFHWSVSHFLALIVQDVWGLRSVPDCSSLLKLGKPGILESPQCDRGICGSTFLTTCKK